MKYEAVDRKDRPARSRQHPTDRESTTPKTESGFAASLHQTIGNQTVQQLHEAGRIQATMRVSQPGDRDEREAERVASDVMRSPNRESAGTVPESVGSTRNNSTNGPPLASRTAHRIESTTSGGESLSPAARSFFEPRFGEDFGDVRIHTGPDANRAARSIDAEAFTYGSDVVFARGNYGPTTAARTELLAHELAHVVQQRGDSPSVQRQSSTRNSGDTAGSGTPSTAKGVPRAPTLTPPVPEPYQPFARAERMESTEIPQGTKSGVDAPAVSTIQGMSIGWNTLRALTTATGALGPHGLMGLAGLPAMALSMLSGWAAALQTNQRIARTVGLCYGMMGGIKAPTMPYPAATPGPPPQLSEYSSAWYAGVEDGVERIKSEVRTAGPEKLAAFYAIFSADGSKTQAILTELWSSVRTNLSTVQRGVVTSTLPWPGPPREIFDQGEWEYPEDK